MPGNQRNRGGKGIMRRINYVAIILVAPTLIYTALVITNPANFFGGGNGERTFAIEYMVLAYEGKASAIQLIGTTIIAFGIIISQGSPNARTASLMGAIFVWIGLIQGMIDNPLLVGATLVIFVGLISLQAFVIGIYMMVVTIARLAPPLTAALILFTNSAGQWVIGRMRSMGNRKGIWLRAIRQTIRQLWPF